MVCTILEFVIEQRLHCDLSLVHPIMFIGLCKAKRAVDNINKNMRLNVPNFFMN
jgi:hypothetical protein